MKVGHNMYRQCNKCQIGISEYGTLCGACWDENESQVNEFIRCRAFGHVWHLKDVNPKPFGTLQCGRCRFEAVDDTNGIRHYRYPGGGPEMKDEADRPALTREEVRAVRSDLLEMRKELKPDGSENE